MAAVLGRRMTVLLIVMSQSTQALAFGSIALFLPLIRTDLGIGFGVSGLLAVATTSTYAAMQIPAGYLSDRFGPHRLFVLGLLGSNLAFLTFSLLDSFAVLLAVQAVSGVFRALVFAPGLMLISTHFAPDRRSTAMGLYVAGGFSSNIVLSLVGPLLVEPLGWRRLFALSAIVALLTVLAYARLGRVVRTSRPTPPALRDLALIAREPILWAAGAVQFVRLAVVAGVTFWLPSYLVDERGYSLGVAGGIIALGAALTAPSNFLGGVVSDRTGRPLTVIRVSLLVLASTLAALTAVRSLTAVILIVAIQAIFLQVYFGPLFEVPITVLGPRTAGSVSGFSNLFANLGSLSATYALGVLRDTSDSFALGFHVLGALCLLALLATIPVARIMGTHRDDAATTSAS